MSSPNLTSSSISPSLTPLTLIPLSPHYFPYDKQSLYTPRSSPHPHHTPSLPHHDMAASAKHSHYAASVVSLSRPLYTVPSGNSSSSGSNGSNRELFADEESIQLVYAGPVQHNHSSSLFRKIHREYFVLTNSALLRFKSLNKATAVFNNLVVFSRDVVRATAPLQIPPESVMLQMRHVYAVYEMEEFRWALRVMHFHPVTKAPAQFVMVLETVNELECWMEALRRATQPWLPLMVTITPSNQQTALERMRRQKDLPDRTERVLLQKIVLLDHPNFPARSAHPALPAEKEVFSHRELSLNVCLAIGRHYFYLLPGAAAADPDYHRIIGHEDRYGLLSIMVIGATGRDDKVNLALRQREGGPRLLTFATAFAGVVISELVRAIDTLTASHQRSYKLLVPDPAPFSGLRPLFDMTKLAGRGLFESLGAYCAGFGAQAARIRVEMESLGLGKPGMRLQLLPPDDGKGYNRFELLVFFRAVRSNPLFREISLRDIHLADLEAWVPRQDEGWATYPDSQQAQHGVNMLTSELYALVVENKNLRKLDLTGCGIASLGMEHTAISVLGSAMQTGQVGLNSLFLGGNRIRGEDLGFLIAGIRGNRKAIRELSIENCGLTTKQLEAVVSALQQTSPEHLTYLDLSANVKNVGCTIGLERLLHDALHLRTLRIRGCTEQIEQLPLRLTKLRHLDIGGIPLSDGQIAFLLSYLSSEVAQCLDTLSVDKCQLHGGQLAQLFRVVPHDLHLSAKENPLARELAMLPKFCYALLDPIGPVSLSLAHTEWDDPSFRELLECLSRNTFLRRLDLAGLKLVGPIEADTGRMLEVLLRENHVLEELDFRGEFLPGEGAVASPMGSMLTGALASLLENRALKRLDITGQGVGDRGAAVISQVLRQNTVLSELAMDANGVTMEGFNLLLSGMTENSTLQKFPRPTRDVRHQIQVLSEEIRATFKYEQEMRFFLAHSTGGDVRRTKEDIDIQLQGRKAAELTRGRIGAVVDEMCLIVEQNRKKLEEVARSHRQHAMRPEAAMPPPSAPLPSTPTTSVALSPTMFSQMSPSLTSTTLYSRKHSKTMSRSKSSSESVSYPSPLLPFSFVPWTCPPAFLADSSPTESAPPSKFSLPPAMRAEMKSGEKEGEPNAAALGPARFLMKQTPPIQAGSN
ncbi:uncharacterized protein VTP21DRAFT_2538 [Calcarisporiella thermophila]|uniref:uncharacterized protein n=1 Tax=Calcarisporiella thermophila TaxID=911321 RepID=UPI003742083C